MTDPVSLYIFGLLLTQLPRRTLDNSHHPFMGLILSLFFNVRPIPPQYQVFINFRGEVMRTEFVWYLVQALKNEKVNVFIDEEEERGKELTHLFNRIQQSRVAITIFTKNYTESHWCLDELAKIKECIDQGNIQAIPIFFKMKTGDVKKLKGKFGDNFKELKCSSRFKHETIRKWEESLSCVSANFGLCSSSYRFQADFLKAIVDAVKKALTNISEREKLSKEENKKPLIENGEEVIKKVVLYLVLFYLLSILIGPYLLSLAIILTIFLDHLKIKEAILSE